MSRRYYDAPRGKKYYAVRIGRHGPQIYESWPQTLPEVLGLSGASFKSFPTRAEAEAWLAELPMPGYDAQHRRIAMGDAPDFLDDTLLVSEVERPPNPGLAVPPQRPPAPRPRASHKPDPFADLDLDGYTSSGSSGTADSDTDSDAEPQLPGMEIEDFEKLVEPEIQLSPEQREVLDVVKAGKSVFFTGAAGTGKSVLLREIIKWCRMSGRGHAVTASTGIASVNIGGSTLHSWAGIGLGQESKEALVAKIFGMDMYQRKKRREERLAMGLDPDDYEELGKNSTTVERWRKVSVLVVDEISMIEGILFDKLEYIAQQVRGRKEPFGGIQLVLSGDFCQLPPIGDKTSKKPPVFAFDAESWPSCIKRVITLQHVFRQKEQSFVDMLNAMRFGFLDSNTIKIFKGLVREVPYDDGLGPTELFPTRNEVDSANISRLLSITHEAKNYEALDVPGWDKKGYPTSKETMAKLLNNVMAQKSLVLKKDAQVMMLKNLIQGQLVNGSIGLIVDFKTAKEALEDGDTLGVSDRAGTALQRAETILDAYNIACEEDQKAKGGFRFKRARHDDYQIPREVVEFINSPKKWPLVRFAHRKVLCVQGHFEVQDAEGHILARRDQVPLILAWALSMHKSQGQTLDRVRVNMGRIFEKGQAYVALSRATSLARLQVLNFDPAKVQVHKRVLEWMQQNGNIPDTIATSIDDTLAFWEDDLE